MVTSADGAPRVSTVADTLPSSSGTTSAGTFRERLGELGDAHAGDASHRPRRDAQQSCVPFIASTIASGSPAWRSSSALENATV